MNKRRALLWVVTVCLLAALLPSTVFAATNGWTQTGGKWYYYDNGYKCTDGSYYIDGAYYCFDANGVLYANQWYMRDGYYYYSNASGVQYHEGVYKIDGVYYGFDWNGRMYADQTFELYDDAQERWVCYRAKADGALYVNQWYYNGNYYYYGANGAQYRNGVYKIDGFYYGFDYNGRMYKNTSFSVSRYDEAKDEYVYTYYRAKADGTLYVNQWYETEWEDWYYYGADGAAPSGFAKIDNVWYYFYDSGYLCESGMVEEDGVYYFIYNEGASYKALYKACWFMIGSDYYYYKGNGELCRDEVKKIDGFYYSFNWEGKMRRDTSFGYGTYDEAKGEYVYTYYRAKADGTLYVNQWYETEWEDWYYYGEGGVAPSGFAKIDNVWYYFYDYGRLCESGMVEEDGVYYFIYNEGASYKALYKACWFMIGSDYYYYEGNGELYRDEVKKIDGFYYGFDWEGKMYKDTTFRSNYYDEAKNEQVYANFRAKADGSLYVNQWYKNASGQYYYYGANGVAPENKNLNIGGFYYGFQYDGRMYADQTFNRYDDMQQRWVCYRAKADGSLYENQWYQSGDDWYYYGAKGKGADDFTNIGGTKYFFREGRMITNSLVWSDDSECYYVISENGMSFTPITKDGWVEVGEDYYYILNGELCQAEVKKIGSFYYGFDGEGKMRKDTAFSSNYHDEAESKWVYSYFRAKADGSLYVNQWYQSGDDWYYYGAAGASYDGIATVGGVKYAFSSRGKMYTDRVWYDDDGKAYAFGKSGQQITARGKQPVGGSYVYVKADGSLMDDGWQEISGKWHYFTPKMQANCLFVDEDNVLYAADNAGVCKMVVKNGIYDIGKLVYLQNGEPVEGWKKVDGAYYYFNPYMVCNRTYDVDGERYVFDEDGKMYTGGWLLIDGSYVYADGTGKAYIGVKNIGGYTYIFDSVGYMFENTTVYRDGVSYVVDGNGVATKAATDGWQAVGGQYYYIRNGEYITGSSTMIDGKRYSFDYNGVMRKDMRYGAMLLGADGAAKTGWQQYGGQWYYGGEDGYLVNGEQTIDGKDYIFSNYALQTGTFVWNDAVVTTDAGGVVVSEKSRVNGWSYVIDKVYFNTGEILYNYGADYTGWVGDYYVMDSIMQIDTIVYDDDKAYILDTYGKYVKNGWYEQEFTRIDAVSEVYTWSRFVYAKAGGVLCCNEWLQLGGAWYYFDGYYMLENCIYKIDGKWCEFDEYGRYLGEVKMQPDPTFSKDGWAQIGSDWYYIHAGEPVTGMNYIDGKWYIFDYSGVMYSSSFVEVEDYVDGYYSGYGWYYVDGNGNKANYTGWKMIGGEWFYFTKDNRVALGWFQDANKTYYGQIDGLVTGYMVYDGELHYFDANGVYQGTRGVKNGWYKANGEWYYFKNGSLTHGYEVIGGKGYYFDGGVMVTNVLGSADGESYAYFGADGVQRTTKGWYKTAEGWIYVGDNGYLYNGIHKIDGREYYFKCGLMVR